MKDMDPISQTHNKSASKIFLLKNDGCCILYQDKVR